MSDPTAVRRSDLRARGDDSTATASSGKKKKSAWKSLPEVWSLIKPRRGLLALGFVLMAINRLSGLVLPASAKYFLDDVINKRQTQLLTPIVLGSTTTRCGSWSATGQP